MAPEDGSPITMVKLVTLHTERSKNIWYSSTLHGCLRTVYPSTAAPLSRLTTSVYAVQLEERGAGGTMATHGGMLLLVPQVNAAKGGCALRPW